MSSTISRDDADKISGDFEKIASRDEKSKGVKSNIKIVLIVVTVMVVMLILLIYFYLKNPKDLIANLSSKFKTPQVELSLTNDQPQAFQNQNYPIPATVGSPLFGGQPLDLS